MKRGAFTLIELMISIVILSLMITYLYKTNLSFTHSNMLLLQESKSITEYSSLEEIIYKDFLYATEEANIVSIDAQNDFVTLQTRHSLHLRSYPYIAYLLREKKLFRIESAQPLKYREIREEMLFDVDLLADKTEKFRLYKAKPKTNNDTNETQKASACLVDIKMSDEKKLLLKLTPLKLEE